MGQVHAEDRRRGEQLEHEVAVADRVETVRRHHGEAKVAREGLAVDGEARSRESPGAERQRVDAPETAVEATAVAL